MAHLIDKYLVVVAIDFGTTYSGYAFSFCKNPEKIFMSKNWGGPTAEYKTTTSLLVSKSQPGGTAHAVAFGHDAEKEYTEHLMFGEDDDDKLYLFRRFKMQLYGKRMHHNLKFKSEDEGLELPALDVFSMALKLMKEKALSDIGNSVRSGLNDSDTLWVLTVPAIWCDSAKDFMRRAAHKAGIIKSADSNQLLIALEPEAASIYCRKSGVEGNQADSSPTKSKTDLSPGTHYLVVDSGGGTVDIACHEITSTGAIKELYKPTGGDWGGTQVDNNFVELLKNILGETFVEDFKQNSKLAWLQFLQAFEKKKREKKDKMNVPVSNELSRLYKEATGRTIESTFVDHKKKGGTTRFGNGHVIMQKDVVQQLFLPVVSKIIDHVKSLLQKPELRRVKCLMLVGGFSECEILKNEFRRHFQSQFNVIIPADAALSVMSGAVMFGNMPTVIASRVARHTYGFAVNEDFVEGRHDRRKAVYGLNGGLVVKDIFSAFVTKNEELRSESVISRQFYPSSRSAHTGVLKLYYTDNTDAVYTYDQGVTELGCITLHVPANSNMDLPMDVDIRFGGTEIHVEMRDPENNDQVRASASISFRE